jgi:hypothetical protein
MTGGNRVGEIKSTLDIVLEKTRNLTLSDEEKWEQKQKEYESRIKGLLQKYQDGLLTKNQLIMDYNGLRKDADLSNDKFLIDEIMNRLDPDQDNQFLLEIIEEGCGLDASSIRAIIDDHRDVYNQAANKRTEQLKEVLAKQYTISGSAVLPNLEADEEWQRQAQEMRNGLEENLSQAKDRLIAG